MERRRTGAESNGTKAVCDAEKAINAYGATSAAAAAMADTRNNGMDKVTQSLSRTRFIASELYRPEALDRPIQGAPMSYCKAARSLSGIN